MVHPCLGVPPHCARRDRRGTLPVGAAHAALRFVDSRHVARRRRCYRDGRGGRRIVRRVVRRLSGWVGARWVMVGGGGSSVDRTATESLIWRSSLLRGRSRRGLSAGAARAPSPRARWDAISWCPRGVEKQRAAARDRPTPHHRRSCAGRFLDTGRAEVRQGVDSAPHRRR